MHLTLGQKATLDSLVNFFGGTSTLVRSWEKDPHYIALRQRGLIRWGKKVFRKSMRECIATPKAVAIAKRFKKDWSAIHADLHPQDPE